MRASFTSVRSAAGPARGSHVDLVSFIKPSNYRQSHPLLGWGPESKPSTLYPSSFIQSVHCLVPDSMKAGYLVCILYTLQTNNLIWVVLKQLGGTDPVGTDPVSLASWLVMNTERVSPPMCPLDDALMIPSHCWHFLCEQTGVQDAGFGYFNDFLISLFPIRASHYGD